MGLMDIAKKNAGKKRGRPVKIKKGKEPKNISDLINDEKKDVKTKVDETVDMLLSDSPINDVLESKDLLDLDEDKDSVLSPETKEWFEEELDRLTKENEELRKQLAVDGSTQKTSNEEWIIKLFIEMQDNYMKFLPMERKTGVPTKVNLNYILEYFIKHFSCVEKYRKI